jgi:hypothetical protein
MSNDHNIKSFADGVAVTWLHNTLTEPEIEALLEGSVATTDLAEPLGWVETAIRERLTELAALRMAPTTGGRLPSREWGVYMLYDDRDTVFYVGMTGVPRTRMRQHSKEFGDRIARYEWRRTESRTAAFDLESALIASFKPRMNIQGQTA